MINAQSWLHSPLTFGGGTKVLLFIIPLWERSGDCQKSPRRTVGWLGMGSLGPHLQQGEAVSS